MQSKNKIKNPRTKSGFDRSTVWIRRVERAKMRDILELTIEPAIAYRKKLLKERAENGRTQQPNETKADSGGLQTPCKLAVGNECTFNECRKPKNISVKQGLCDLCCASSKARKFAVFQARRVTFEPWQGSPRTEKRRNSLTEQQKTKATSGGLQKHRKSAVANECRNLNKKSTKIKNNLQSNLAQIFGFHWLFTLYQRLLVRCSADRQVNSSIRRFSI